MRNIRNPAIQLVSCTLQPESSLRSIPIQQLFFPTDWIEPLSTLQSERSNRPEKPATALIKSLNAVLQAFLPDLLAAPNAVKRDGRPFENEGSENRQNRTSPWLLTQSVFPPGTLWRIIQIWFQETYGECDSFSELEAVLREDDLQWQPYTLALFQKTCGNGTADIPSLAYKVIPSLLADLLVERKVKLTVGKSPRYLAKIVTDEGAELMTWPPVYVETKPRRKGSDKKKFGYSYTVKITLQTIPGYGEPRIHFHYGVRRWHCESCYSGDETTLYLKRHTSVYFRPQKKWYESSSERSKTFLQAKIETVKNGEHGERIPLWMNLVPKIAARIDVPLPDAHIMAKQPLLWLEGVHGLEAGMIYTTPKNLPIGVGIGPDVCEDITKRLTEALSDHLTLQSLCQPYIIPSKDEHHPLMKDLREIPEKIRLEALEQSVGPRLTIEIRWTTDSVRDMLFDRVEAMLKGTRPELIFPEDTQSISEHEGELEVDDPSYNFMDEDTEEDDEDIEEVVDHEEEMDASFLIGEQSQSKKPRRKRAKEPDPKAAPAERILPLPGGGRVRIVTSPLQTINDPLPAKGGKQSRSALFQERATLITRLISPAQEPTLTFFELPDYREPQLRRQFGFRGDPKPAIRLGMAHTGRLTQFITSEQKSLRERCASSVRDGLRQLGYLPYPIGFSMQNIPIPDPLLVLGIWFIRITRRRAAVGVHLPVIVLLHTARRQVMAWLPHDGRVRPYSQALLEITHLNPEQVKKRKREEALGQVRQFLLGNAMRQGVGDIVAFTMAQNARSTWPGLYNTEVPFDALRFERGEIPFPSQSLPARLRFVRVRTNTREETPEWYVPGSQPSTTTRGVWVEDGVNLMENRLFYNIAGKPHTNTQKYIGKQDKPRENYRLSSIVEVMPLILHEQDQPITWAVAVDQWRRMGYLTSDMTLLPLPLELARKMGEYAEVIGPWVFPDEWEEEGDDEEEEVEREDGTSPKVKK